MTEPEHEWGCRCPKTGRLINVGFYATRSMLRRYDALCMRVHCDECQTKHSTFVGDLMPIGLTVVESGSV